MFTKREIQIILLIAKGYQSAEIAEKLFITRETLKTHRKNIIRKIRESSPAEISLPQFAVAFARNIEKSP